MTLPSGATVGEEEPSSRTRPGPDSLTSGSTPRCAPALQPPGPPIGSNTPQPSFRRPRSEAFHLRVRFGLTAIRKLYRVTKCPRLAVYTVPSEARAGATLIAGRCEPQGV